ALERRAADEVARCAPVDGPAEAGLERRDRLVHVLAVEVHAGLETQRIAGAEAAGLHARLDERRPQRLDMRRRQRDLEAVLAGVAGARDEVFDAVAGEG